MKKLIIPSKTDKRIAALEAENAELWYQLIVGKSENAVVANKIQRFYEKKLWSKEQVLEAVEANEITKEEYVSITSEI